MCGLPFAQRAFRPGERGAARVSTLVASGVVGVDAQTRRATLLNRPGRLR